jgi:hypothetical protein
MGFVRRWNLYKQSKEIQLSGRLHVDPCNGPRFLLPGVRMQVKLTKAKPSFYLMHIDPAHLERVQISRSETVYQMLQGKPRTPYSA